MARFPRRRLAFLAAVAGLDYSTRRYSVHAQPPDVPGAYANVPMLPGVAGPYSALAGVDPGAALPAAWVPRGGAVAALPALPSFIQAWVDAAITYKPARTAFSPHAYGYDQHKLGNVWHIPVAGSLPALDNWFLSGQMQGLTTFGVGRQKLLDLEITMPDGARWRVPVAPVSQYGPAIGPWAPYAQGIVHLSGNCALAPHPVFSYLGSGVPNGAAWSWEMVAWSGADGITDPQLNCKTFGMAMSSAYFGHEISPRTEGWHGQIDRVDRCFDPGWAGGPFGGIEAESQAAARALLAGDPSLLRGVVRISASPPAISWQSEAWSALVHKRLRVQQDAIRAAVRDEADERTNAALMGLDPSGWQGVTLATWREQIQRDDDDIARSAGRRDAALAQVQRLGG